MKIEMRPLDSIREYGKNPRVIPASAIEAVAKSLREFGFRVPVIVDKDGVIVCGHTRVKAAWSLGMAEVPCVVADDLTPAQVQAFRIADNQTASLTEFDDDLLKAELADLKALDFDLGKLGFGEELAEKMAEDSATQDLPSQSSKPAGIVAMLHIPPRAWLIQSDEMRESFDKLAADYGVVIEWPE